MTRKQKKELYRIVASVALFAAGLLVSQNVVKLALFLAAYLLVGFGVLKEAAEGIIGRVNPDGTIIK